MPLRSSQILDTFPSLSSLAQYLYCFRVRNLERLSVAPIVKPSNQNLFLAYYFHYNTKTETFNPISVHFYKITSVKRHLKCLRSLRKKYEAALNGAAPHRPAGPSPTHLT